MCERIFCFVFSTNFFNCGCVFVLILFAILCYLIHRWYRRDFISDFATKYVFVTGCDSGFGHELVIELDRMGVNVYAACYTDKGAEDVKSKSSQRLKTILLDVTDQNSINRAKEFVENDLPAGKHLWGLVNNAGISGNVIFPLSVVDDYRKVMEVNFFGTIKVTQTFVPLIKRAKGRIVNVISIAGRIVAGFEPYTSSKFALQPFTDGLRRHMKSFGVHVAIIEPGHFLNETNIMNAQTWTEVGNGWNFLPDEERKELGKDFVQKAKYLLTGMANEWPLHRFNTKDMVVGAMTHALGAKHPKCRYLCGYDARPMVFFGTFAPDWLLDSVLGILQWTFLNRYSKENNNSLDAKDY